MIGRKKVFPLSRPRQPKLPSSGVQRGQALATRYPGLCRVCAITMLVFEQIGKYCGRLRAFLGLFDDFLPKIFNMR